MNDEAPKCLICTSPLVVGLATGRKSGKPSVTFRCPVDGRHFRAFITHRPYVERLVKSLEANQESKP